MISRLWKKAAEVLKELGISDEMDISSAHRLPEKTANYAKTVRCGIEVLIAGAGMAAHLAGVLAAHTTLPVIGIPIKSGALNGADALYSTVQMPPGVPVATVGIDGAKNAAYLASRDPLHQVSGDRQEIGGISGKNKKGAGGKIKDPEARETVMTDDQTIRRAAAVIREEALLPFQRRRSMDWERMLSIPLR